MLKIAFWPADGMGASDCEALNPSDGAVAKRIAQITRACLDAQGCSGVPDMQCAYTDHHHFTLRRYVHAASAVMPLPCRWYCITCCCIVLSQQVIAFLLYFPFLIVCLPCVTVGQHWLEVPLPLVAGN